MALEIIVEDNTEDSLIIDTESTNLDVDLVGKQ